MPGMQQPVVDSWADLVDAAAAMAGGPGRQILGIAGAPGAGKSVLAQQLTDLLVVRGYRVALVGMDGFHLAGAELNRLGRTDRKGAPDTFDVDGYIALLGRLRRPAGGTGEVVYAPVFDRSIEDPIGSAVPVAAEINLVVTEGNYLLHKDGPWPGVRALLDACWYVELDEQVRIERLIARHIQFGRSRKDAVERAEGSDLHNAHLVARSKVRADRVVVVPELPRR
jgi:pantothenate kinase